MTICVSNLLVAQTAETKAANDVAKAEEKLAQVKQEYEKWQAKWESLTDLEKAYRWVDVGIPLGAAKAAYETAKAVVDVAKRHEAAVKEKSQAQK